MIFLWTLARFHRSCRTNSSVISQVINWPSEGRANAMVKAVYPVNVPTSTRRDHLVTRILSDVTHSIVDSSSIQWSLERIDLRQANRASSTDCLVGDRWSTRVCPKHICKTHSEDSSYIRSVPFVQMWNEVNDLECIHRWDPRTPEACWTSPLGTSESATHSLGSQRHVDSVIRNKAHTKDKTKNVDITCRREKR